jgi:hypothetical protein
MTNSHDNQGNPGITFPPALIYLLPLVLGLLIDRRVHVSFLPRSVARGLGWPLLGGCCSQGGFVKRCARPKRRYALTGLCRN